MAKDNFSVRIEDVDPIFSGKKEPTKSEGPKLEDLDPIFKDKLPTPTDTAATVPTPPQLPAGYQMVRNAIFGEGPIQPGQGEFAGGVLGGVAGSLEQGRNILNLLPAARAMGQATTPTPPPTAGSGAAWLRNWAGMDRPIAGGVPEGAQAYQRAKTHGEAGSKLWKRFGNQPLDIARYAEQAEEAERVKRASNLAQAAGKTSRALGYVPGLSLLAGTAGGADLVEALRRYEKGDYGGAAIKGIGGLGALASLIPHPVTRLGGGALSLLAMPLDALYQGTNTQPAPINYTAP